MRKKAVLADTSIMDQQGNACLYALQILRHVGNQVHRRSYVQDRKTSLSKSTAGIAPVMINMNIYIFMPQMCLNFEEYRCYRRDEHQDCSFVL